MERWSSEKFEWHLYEELTRKIRATSRRLFKNSLPVPSLDTSIISQKRSSRVKEFVKFISCYYMSGTEEQISKGIFKLINKNFCG